MNGVIEELKGLIGSRENEKASTERKSFLDSDFSDFTKVIKRNIPRFTFCNCFLLIDFVAYILRCQRELVVVRL